MKDILLPALELLILLPGLALAYLPMKQYLKLRPLKLAGLMLPSTILLCLAGGAASCFLSIRVHWMFLAAAAAAGTLYVRTLNVSRWKSVSVFLAICAVFSCLWGVATAIDSILKPGSTAPWFSPWTILILHLMCWAFTALAGYPASHGVRGFMEDESFAQTWYLFWILPVSFIILNMTMIPIHPGILNQGRLIEMYIMISLALLFLLLLFYAMFFLMANSLNRNDRLRQENQFLSMQQAQYENLKTSIAETREARHDMRHHLNALAAFARRQEWDQLTRYLFDAQEKIPDAELNLCDNIAADSVASYYGMLCRRQDVPISFALDLPVLLPVPEIDLCLVLSNLLENALEASLKTAPARRGIRVRAYLRSDRMVLLTVENAFDGEIREKDGVFQSSKRRGNGVGLQSVRRIAEKNGGYSRFLHENGRFCANVLLRGETGGDK